MLGFMDYVQNAFYEATRWDRDNSYGSLTDTARALLDFSTPHGLRLHVSSLSSPNFATSYTLGSIGLVDGSLSYLYSSLPLTHTISKSRLIPLNLLVPGYRQLQDLRQPDESWRWEVWQRGKRVDRRDSLLYGRLYLPTSTLEALYLHRLTPRTQLHLSCVSDARLPNNGSILALLHHDAARYSAESIYSTDSALLGFRALYNFGPDPLPSSSQHPPHHPTPTPNPNPNPDLIPSPPRPHGRFSTGLELYYGLLNKSFGTSLGLRFATLPSHPGFPYTMTLTLNPLMGSLSSSYSVRTSSTPHLHHLTLSSRFDFNVYSYESDLRVGMELWRPCRPSSSPNSTPDNNEPDNPPTGILKARIDQHGTLAVRWEGKFKELLYRCGVEVGFRRLGGGFIGGVGVEICYSS